MPWAFAAFAFASLSLAGAPPLAGAWSLLWLIAAAGQAGWLWAAALALAAAVLAFAAFGPMAARALFGAAPEHPFERPDAASAFVIAPTAISGLITLLVLFLVDALAMFLGVGLSP
jgi:formate hydrogenlyase subunit 3/multisubunit Na+/H+ antiporter MnhD subunit